MRRRAVIPALAGCAAALSFGARTQAPWPDRPITLVLPFPPGGVADTVAQPVAEALGRELKQTVIVENRVGAGGALGIGSVVRAPADGQTLLMSLSSISILPEANVILARKPAYALKQFIPIARFTADPRVLVVRADAPWANLADFIADLKQKPGRYKTAARATTAPCTCRWRCSRPRPDFAWCTFPLHRCRAGRAGLAERPGGRGGQRTGQRAAVDQGRQAAGPGALGRQAPGRPARPGQPDPGRPPGAVCPVVGAVRGRRHA